MIKRKTEREGLTTLGTGTEIYGKHSSDPVPNKEIRSEMDQ